MKFITTCTKRFANLPFAHRQHNHDGHCRLIHGHNWTFEITFACSKLDGNQFVIDFGKLKFVREWLEGLFDHTLVLNVDDPFVVYLEGVLVKSPAGWENGSPFAKLVLVPNCGAEGLGLFVMGQLNSILASSGIGQDRNLHVSKVIVWEDEKNSAEVTLQLEAADAITAQNKPKTPSPKAGTPSPAPITPKSKAKHVRK